MWSLEAAAGFCVGCLVYGLLPVRVGESLVRSSKGMIVVTDCVCLPKCPFFLDKMSNMPAMADIYKDKYCRTDSSDCMRYMVYRKMGAGQVPVNLFPNDRAQAEAFLAENGF